MLRSILGILLLWAALSGDLALAQDAPPPSAPLAQAGKPKIAVLPLKGEGTGAFGNQQDEMYQTVASSFFQTRRFELMERGQLAAVLGEAKFQNAGLVDDASAVALGKQLGVKFVVLGSYSGAMNRSFESDASNRTTETWPAEATVSLRMVSVETGQIEETFKATGTAKEPNFTRSMTAVMRDLSVKLNREVSNKFPVNGYIIKVTGEREAMIDLGGKDGVAEGDRFLVVEWGDDIIHPVTGKIIKGKKTVLSELKVTRVDEETSEVKTVGSKVTLKLGQVLESVPKKASLWESLRDKER